MIMSSHTAIKWVVHCQKNQFDVYIGRPSKFGNPFIIGIDGSRREVIERCENYLYTRPQLIKSIRQELKNKILGCWCDGVPCHGDLLVRIANGWQLPPLENL